jgi:murein DD-endopeptidase MepM/ murein hydrolase activator NlpD
MPVLPVRLSCLGAVLTLLLSFSTGVSVSGQASPLSLSIVNAPRPMRPGGVALLTVTATHDLVAVTGELSGRPVHFWASASSREWSALVGINVDAAPGPLPLTIQGRTADGASASTKVSLLVERYQFETRRLRVDPKMANPPETEVARIKQEAQAMAEAFAIVTPERYWQGPFNAPVPGTATSSFGRLTVTNGKPAGRHQGADFRAATGTPIRAPNAGRVVIAQNLYFAGNTVIIDHGLGVFSLLAHLSSIAVVPGVTVARGDLLGASGATGRVTGPHLHWAVRLGDLSVDPLSLISALAESPDETAHPSH